MPYRSIAFGGGGMRGAVYVGALKAIREVQGSLEFPDGVYGSSVGAIAATLVAFNIPFETIEAAFQKYFKRSAWIPNYWLNHAFSASERKGVFSMEKLRQLMFTMLTECGIKDIETKRICDAPQPLFLVASNLTTRRPAILTGEVPLVQAILCSACIPGLFEPQVLYGDVYLDAAVYARRMELIAPSGALVFLLHGRGSKITPKSSLSEILYACYAGTTTGSKPGQHICQFEDISVGVLEEITDAQREELVQLGYSQTLAFLTKMAAKER